MVLLSVDPSIFYSGAAAVVLQNRLHQSKVWLMLRVKGSCTFSGKLKLHYSCHSFIKMKKIILNPFLWLILTVHISSCSLELSSPWLSPETYIKETPDISSSRLQVVTWGAEKLLKNRIFYTLRSFKSNEDFLTLANFLSLLSHLS